MKALFYIVFLIAAVSVGIQAQAELKNGTQISAGETLSLKSAQLGEDREIRVFLPRSYANSGKNYPVIYALDGEGTGTITANAVEFMTGYSAVPQMPEAIVVAVINSNRNRDMPIPEGYGKAGETKFLAFLADELIPAVEKKFRTQPLRILLGHSQGGLFAHFALTVRPEAFQWFISIDAPLAGFAAAKPLMEKVKTTVSKTPNYRGRLVSIENLYGWRNEWTALTNAAPKGFYGQQLEIKDETHETMAYKAVYEGLKRLFYDYAPNIVRENKAIYTLPLLKDRYKTVSQEYGYQVEIPNRLLLDAADQNIAIQHGPEAVALINHSVAIYGESFRTERQLNEAQEAVKKGRNSKLEELMNLPAPAFEAMKPFVGIWERKQDSASWIIAFEAKNDAVVAQNTVIPPTFEPFHLEVQFVRVLDGQQLQWGERNGKGPGITVYTAKLVDQNTLAGTAEGIGFIMPRPSFSFIYKRRPAEDKK